MHCVIPHFIILLFNTTINEIIYLLIFKLIFGTITIIYQKHMDIYVTRLHF